ncbi:MAG: hypothetical protein CL920_18080 [Deltaproteobacteria bacterium]|mgnify:CR=1 FL=1|nr:hypothetical protein [Deltaproteobacteria bacterium]
MVCFQKSLLCLLIGLILSSSAPAFAADCTSLYRQKKLEAAGDCFTKQANAMGDSAKLPTLKQYAKGRLLRNAATAYTKAAQKASEDKALKLRLKAIQRLEKTLKEELYESTQIELGVRDKIKALRKSTGVAQINVLTYDPKAKICFRSATKTTCQTGNKWQRQIKKGAYTLEVTYPSGKVIKRRITVAANANITQTFSPPQGTSSLQLMTQHPSAKMILTGAALKKPLAKMGSEWKLKIAPGTYQLALSYPGIPTLKKTIHVNVGEIKKVTFKPPSSTLTVHSTPPGAKLYINGSYRGLTPIDALVIDGELLVTLRKGCHDLSTQKLSINPRSKKKITVKLTEEPVYSRWLYQKRSQGSQQTLGVVGLIGGIAILGVSASGYIASTLSFQEADKQKEAYLTARENPEQYVAPYESAASTGNMWRTVGHAGAGVGGLLTGLGLIRLVTLSLPPSYTLDCKIRIPRK